MGSFSEALISKHKSVLLRLALWVNQLCLNVALSNSVQLRQIEFLVCSANSKQLNTRINKPRVLLSYPLILPSTPSNSICLFAIAQWKTRITVQVVDISMVHL
jgi:hypothetical protein